MNREMIDNLIKKHEGTSNSIYTDSRGFLTVGAGFNLDAAGAKQVIQNLGLDYNAICAGQPMTDAQVDTLFEYCVNKAIADTQSIVPNFATLPDQVQAVLVDMTYNLGRRGFGAFTNMLAAIRAYDYRKAADEAENSLWYRQVGNRGKEDVEMLRSVTA